MAELMRIKARNKYTAHHEMPRCLNNDVVFAPLGVAGLYLRRGEKKLYCLYVCWSSEPVRGNVWLEE